MCRVYVRIKPLAAEEQHADWHIKDGSISQQRHAGNKAYQLDRVFDGEADTQHVYAQTTQPLIKGVIDGYNCTVFAYGQTSSGKTHTMRGTPADEGIIGKAIADLFEAVAGRSHERDVFVRVSYMEVRPLPCKPSRGKLLAVCSCHCNRQRAAHLVGESGQS